MFRLPESLGPRADTYTTGSVLAGVDKPVGRQRVKADLAARRQRFSRLEELNHTGYGANAGLDWETAGRVSGQLKARAERSLAPYGSPFAPAALQERNLQREREWGASVQRGTVQSRLQPFAAYNERKTRYSAAAYRFRDNDRRALRAGVRWRPSDRTTLGVAAVEARGKYPFSRVDGVTEALADRYRSHGLEVTADWAATGKSHLDGRLGWEQRRYALATRRDFSGLNGLLRWRWEPTGKLSLTTSLLRDADDTDRLIPAGPTDLTVAGSRITNTALLDGTWRATAKLNVNANLRWSDRQLVNPAVDAGGTVLDRRGKDKTRFAGVGVTWAATDQLSAGCTVGRESRTTDSSLSFPYKANTVSCQVQALLK